MAYNGNILTSLRGRRLGLQMMTSAQSGGSRGNREYLVGPDDFRTETSTAESTATNLHPFGISQLPVSTAASSQVYTIDPPVPGVIKGIVGTTVGACYLKTANSEAIVTSAGSSFTTIKLSSLGGSFALMGLTTAMWAAVGLTTAAGHSLTTTT
jgi:hypothetical protein